MLALLGGCNGASQPAVPFSSASDAAGSARQNGAFDAGLYAVAFEEASIFGYKADDRRNRPPRCSIGGVAYVNDIAVDGKGNLIDPDGGSRTIRVFSGPGMCGPEIGSVSDPYGEPSDAASADAATGTIVVSNIFDGSGSGDGSLSLCTLSGGCTINLTNPQMHEVGGVALALNGDCWASVLNTNREARLIYFKGCSGPGRVASGFRNASLGGLDIDDAGNVVAIGLSGGAYVYKGCDPRCTRLGGPFPLSGTVVFGHLNQQSTRLAVGNSGNAGVDVYRYSPTSITYIYSFNNGFSASDDVGGVAYNPRSKE